MARARRTSSPDDLPTRRWRLFLAQYGAAFGDGWQSNLAEALGLDASAINKQQAGSRSPSRQTISLACTTLGIDSSFFYDVTLGDEPLWTEHRTKAGGPKVVPMNPHWLKFKARGRIEALKLTPEQVEWIRTAPFRGGPQSPEDYERAAEAIVRHLPLDPEFEKA